VNAVAATFGVVIIALGLGFELPIVAAGGAFTTFIAGIDQICLTIKQQSQASDHQ
jgi:hypothetical protein